MTKKNKTSDQMRDKAAVLKVRLAESEETLHAIRQHMVDAFVVDHTDGAHIVTLSTAEYPYRMMVESMNEGAVTLIPGGTIFYSNPRFGQMAEIEPKNLIGMRFQDLVLTEQQPALETLLANSASAAGRGQFLIRTASGKLIPVQLSIFRLAGAANGIAVLVSDMTERARAEEKIRALAEKLTMAEQDEQRRISQILHDDLQQRLFAIKAQLSLLRDMSGKIEDGSSLHEEMDQMQELLSEAITITRNLSIDLSPSVLQTEGLNGAIIWLAVQMKQQYDFHVEFGAPTGSHTFNQQMRLLLFQAIRELLFNVVKHAGILKATVTMEQVDPYMYITISDNGNGFDAESVMQDPQQAHGLLFIQDRLSLMGCSMEVTSRIGNGTKIIIKTPLK